MKGSNFVEKIISNLKNEEGSVIVIVLIILVALTMIGIVSMDNTVVELQIVRNETIYRQNLYKAESAAIEAAQFMDDNNLNINRNWISTAGPDNYATTALWDNTDSMLSNNMNNPAQNNVRYAARFNEIVGSQNMTNLTFLYAYSVYGRFNSTTGQGRSLIRMGYNKRY